MLHDFIASALLFLFFTFLIYINTALGAYIGNKNAHPQDSSNPTSTVQHTRSQRSFSMANMLLTFVACYALIIGIRAIEFKYTNTKMQEYLENNNNNGTNISNNAQNPNSNENSIEILYPHNVKTKFSDVAGLAEAKEELQDIIKYLKDPKKFSRLGAKPPKGILMVGPPGTGKTLLARAIAGEASVTFIAASGSQFDEEYVGVGAARVRKLFTIARQNAPCIIFIDEIDSLAANRKHHDTNSGSQTVNQLLTEMDGLNQEKNSGIMIVAASNRLDILDPAVLRPGRFDRQIKLELPTLTEREEILRLHVKKIKSKNLDLKSLAKRSTGFSSADLANLVNEAAIIATKNNADAVEMRAFEQAKDRIILGNKRLSIKLTEYEKKLTAYHEAGHALVGMSVPNFDNIYKVTISPRGFSLGHTSFEPDLDKYSYSRAYLENMISMQLAGRIAEELVFGANEVTTGAENDFQNATALAHNMVTRWGFSKKIGPVFHTEQLNFIPKKVIEAEVQEIIKHCYANAKSIIEKNIDALHNLAAQLLEHETLEAKQVRQIVGKKKVS